jgi:chromosome segregation ATPase
VVRLQTGRLADGSIPKSAGNKSGPSATAEAKPEPATEVLVLKSKLVAQRQLIESLGERVEELVRSNEHQLRQKDMAHSDRVAGVTSKFTVELQGCQKRFRELMGEKETLEAEYELKLEKLRAANAAELATRKEQYKVKIETERSRKDLLQEDRKEAAKEWEASMVALDVEQSAALQKLKATFEAEREAEQRAAAALRAEKSMLVGKWAKVQKHVEADSDAEVDGIKATYEQRLRSEQAAAAALKEEHAVMKKKYQALVKDVKEQEDKIKRLNALESQLKEVVLGLDKDIAGHKKEVRTHCLSYKMMLIRKRGF